MTPLRLVFFGTAEIAVPSLEALAADPAYVVTAVVTQPDRAKGRDLQLQPSAVKQAALRLGLPVHQPDRCKHDSFLQVLRGLAPDLIVVAAYGQILPQALLDLPPHGCLNVHASLLPRHRGAAPIQWAILEGDLETGITIMKMDAGLDTGAMLLAEPTPIGPEDTTQTLHDRLALIGAALLRQTIPGYLAGQLQPTPQPAEGVTYARKITKEDGRMDWSEPAGRLALRVRAFTPWPGAFTFVPDADRPKILKIWRAAPDSVLTGPPGTVLVAGKDRLVVACGEGALELLELQREGGRRLPARGFLAGCALAQGLRLG